MQRHLAPAKLTLSLRITGRRPDGYHLLDAEMVTLDLADTLLFSEGDGLEVHLAPGGPDLGGADCGGADRGGDDRAGDDRGDGVPVDGSNTVVRALAAVGRRALVRLEKRIPPGAGLGGGSSDAAAVLRWAGCGDLAVAASIGADVPFCMVGGRARVGGIGELVEPLPLEARTYTLLTPPFGVATAAVYRAWDEIGGPSGDAGNDLEPAALEVAPALARWRDLLGDACGLTPRLAGSGSTWFVEGDFPGGDRLVARTGPRGSGATSPPGAASAWP